MPVTSPRMRDIPQLPLPERSPQSFKVPRVPAPVLAPPIPFPALETTQPAVEHQLASFKEAPAPKPEQVSSLIPKISHNVLSFFLGVVLTLFFTSGTRSAAAVTSLVAIGYALLVHFKASTFEKSLSNSQARTQRSTRTNRRRGESSASMNRVPRNRSPSPVRSRTPSPSRLSIDEQFAFRPYGSRRSSVPTSPTASPVSTSPSISKQIFSGDEVSVMD